MPESCELKEWLNGESELDWNNIILCRSNFWRRWRLAKVYFCVSVSNWVVFTSMTRLKLIRSLIGAFVLNQRRRKCSTSPASFAVNVVAAAAAEKVGWSGGGARESVVRQRSAMAECVRVLTRALAVKKQFFDFTFITRWRRRRRSFLWHCLLSCLCLKRYTMSS